jgi:outer membrane lipoprotein-sorting protein
MLRKALILTVGFLMACLFLEAQAQKSSADLTVDQIVARNIAARGGLEAWRDVQSLSMMGRMEAGGKHNMSLPFVLELARGRRKRLEIQFHGQTAVQVYDGVNGWKLRPFLNRHQVEPYTPDEVKLASYESDLDGPLVDYSGKGTRIELDGQEKVDDHDAYRLKLTLKGGQVRHLWIDAKSFLELKIDGTTRRMDGRYRPVATYFREYTKTSGLILPSVLETVVEGVKRPEKIRTQSVVVNAGIDGSRFAKPL